MASNLSIAQMLTELEGQIKHPREQEEHHAQQEVFHREKRGFHAAELATTQERFAAFQAVAVAAGELAERHKVASAPSPPPSEEEIPAGKRRPVGRLVARVVESRQPEETFNPSDIAREVNRRYGAKLRQPLDGRAASVTLRRLAAAGRLHVAREGTAHREALYSRSRPARRER